MQLRAMFGMDPLHRPRTPMINSSDDNRRFEHCTKFQKVIFCFVGMDCWVLPGFLTSYQGVGWGGREGRLIGSNQQQINHYLSIHLPLIITFREAFKAKITKYTGMFSPSWLAMVRYAMLEPAYLLGCPGRGQSACILTLTTSVGWAEMTARAPVVIPAKMRMPAGGLLGLACEDNVWGKERKRRWDKLRGKHFIHLSCNRIKHRKRNGKKETRRLTSQYKSLTASYIPIRTDAKHICRWRPGTSPLYSARAPSSLRRL